MNLRNTNLLVGIIPIPKISQLSVSVCTWFPDQPLFSKSMYQKKIFFFFLVLGARACIGRKFASIEATCFLTLLLRDFKVEPLLRVGETKEQWRDRVLDARITLTLGVLDIPVRFIRRS